jgi:NAD(P)-dependent dehydrogenase (short-subunit alcohol dehydrogenase family)
MVKGTKVVVITGVSRGLGQAMVDEFLRAGHRVAGCSRSHLATDKAGQAEEAEMFAAVDVRQREAVEAWAAKVIERMGPPDLLLNNAALIHANSELWRIPAEEFDAVVDVNIKGVVNVTRAFLPAMIKAKRGVVVNFSSGWGRSVDAEVSGYCATKWAIEGLSKALGLELPEPLACVPLSPGIIDTQMLRSCFGNAADSHEKPAEWAKRAIPFLLRLGRGENGKSLSL